MDYERRLQSKIISLMAWRPACLGCAGRPGDPSGEGWHGGGEM